MSVHWHLINRARVLRVTQSRSLRRNASDQPFSRERAIGGVSKPVPEGLEGGDLLTAAVGAQRMRTAATGHLAAAVGGAGTSHIARASAASCVCRFSTCVGIQVS